jgi:hypothetical protein
LTAVVAIPDVTIPIEPIDNTGGNQCYDEHNIPQVRPAHANVYNSFTCARGERQFTRSYAVYTIMMMIIIIIIIIIIIHPFERSSDQNYWFFII